MGRTRVALLMLLASLSHLATGCELGEDPTATWQDRPLSHVRATPSAEQHPESALDLESRKVAFELAVAERRLAFDPPLPRSLDRQVCPDDELRDSADPPLLHLRVRDSRADRRQLLPLSVTDRIAVDELEAIRGRFEQPADDLAARTFRRTKSLEDAVIAQRELASLARRPFLAMAHVINYGEPRLTRKPNAPRRHWVPGVLDTLLVVYDLHERAPLCQVRVTVQNDTTDAPIRLRMRSDTRERLKDQLGEIWHEKAAAQLGSISAFLSWPVNVPPERKGR